MREQSWADQIIHRFDKILQALPKHHSPIKNIAQLPTNDQLSTTEKAHSATLMRINHSGEVCAQALYLGQGLVARDKKLAEQLYQAAEEEQAHLSWCHNRLVELN